MNAIRWSDNDRYFGPLTFAKTNHGWGIVLGSGDGDDYPGCRLTVFAFGRTLIVALPQWMLKPHRKKVYPGTAWSVETVARLGRDWYYDTTKREFGIRYRDGHLTIEHGPQPMEWPNPWQHSWIIPWTQWRHVRHSIYNLEGRLFADLPKGPFLDTYGATKALENACPASCFAFKDFDGEELVATTRIEEREWRFGTGYFKWLSMFRRPKIRRSLDLEFSGETGKRKGSWKGGTIGTGIDLAPGELHESGFRRYCAENNMTFLASVDTLPEGQDRETGLGAKQG